MRLPDIINNEHMRRGFDSSHFEEHEDGFLASSKSKIDCSVDFLGCPEHMGEGIEIEHHVSIGTEVIIDEHASIGAYTHIGRSTLIAAKVHIADRAYLGSEVAIGSPSQDGFGNYIDDEYDGVGHMAIIGDGVVLPGGLSVPEGFVIPKSEAYTSIGFMGSSSRLVGVFGTDHGPRFSVGCQKGISIDEFRERVKNATETSVESANSYRPYLKKGGVFEAAASVVQREYEKNDKLVEDLKVIHDEVVLSKTPHTYVQTSDN